MDVWEFFTNTQNLFFILYSHFFFFGGGLRIELIKKMSTSGHDIF